MSATAQQKTGTKLRDASMARNTPDELFGSETRKRCVAPRRGFGEGVSQADSRERPAPNA